MATPLLAVDYDAWVEEGDNYAGFTGYRPRKIFFFSHEELDEWLINNSDAILGAFKRIVLKHIYVCSVEDKLDLSFVMKDLALRKKAQLAKIEEVEAEAELQRAQRRLEQVKAMKK